jgi:hypothetical protein
MYFLSYRPFLFGKRQNGFLFKIKNIKYLLIFTLFKKRFSIIVIKLVILNIFQKKIT